MQTDEGHTHFKSRNILNQGDRCMWAVTVEPSKLTMFIDHRCLSISSIADNGANNVNHDKGRAEITRHAATIRTRHLGYPALYPNLTIYGYIFGSSIMVLANLTLFLYLFIFSCYLQMDVSSLYFTISYVPPLYG